jgi:DNA-cytosine methyltransferase
MNVDTTKKFNHISLCTGYGGIDLGLSRILPNLRTVAYCEIELYAIENLISKMENGILPPCPIWSNLKTFPFEQFLGKVDFLSGGFPCQPFSDAGSRLGDEDPRHLFPFIKEGIKKCRPAFVFLENVRGIVSSTLRSDWGDDPKGTPVLLHVCRELERIGYSVEWGLFTARETGLPHRRQRVFILGKRKDITNSELARFSEYFQNSSKGEHTTRQDKTNIVYRKSENSTCEKRSSDGGETFILQRFTKGIGELATIESESIALPSGRDREQREYEPPRTLIRTIMDNANKVGFWRYNDEHPNQTPQDGRGQGRSEIDVASTQRNIQQVTQYEQQNDEGIEGVERSEPQREQIYDQSEMGGDANGASDWLDYERLCYSFSSVNDEIAMLGNGVVPATAEIAFRTLFSNFVL